MSRTAGSSAVLESLQIASPAPSGVEEQERLVALAPEVPGVDRGDAERAGGDRGHLRGLECRSRGREDGVEPGPRGRRRSVVCHRRAMVAGGRRLAGPRPGRPARMRGRHPPTQRPRVRAPSGPQEPTTT